MPGRGCQERKAARREAKRAALEAGLIAEDGTLLDDDEGQPEFAIIGNDGQQSVIEAQLNDVERAISRRRVSTARTEEQKHIELCKALAEAVREYDLGIGASVSALATHYKVHAAKRDPCFNNIPLVDMLAHHTEIFQVTLNPDDPNKSIVKLVPGATTHVIHTAPEGWDDGLPPSIEQATDPMLALQAVRIEIIRAVTKRGGTCNLNDVGQEPILNKHRKEWLSGITLLTLAKTFPDNFELHDQSHGQFGVELLSVDVTDVTMIAGFDWSRVKGKGKGKGSAHFSKGKDKGKDKGSEKGKFKGKDMVQDYRGPGPIGKGMGNGMMMMGSEHGMEDPMPNMMFQNMFQQFTSNMSQMAAMMKGGMGMMSGNMGGKSKGKSKGKC